MKVAFTADIHLNGDTEYRERFNALVEVLKIIKNEQIQYLIIAGDCFDQESSNINLLEKALEKSNNTELRVFLLPGNHDCNIKQSQFPQSQIYVIENTQKIELGGRSFLFVPYKEQRIMGAEIGKFASTLKNSKWILVAHGDLSSNSALRTAYEIGTYMPLSSRDIEIFQPKLVLLGHIHMPVDLNYIHYPGSPCGLDITETGRRRFLVMDTDTFAVAPRYVKTDTLFVNERVLLFPSENEDDFLKSKLERIFLPYEEDDLKKISCRINIVGYSFDRNNASKFVESYLTNILRVKTLEVRIIDLLSAKSDQVRLRISEKVLKTIENTELLDYELVREGIIEESLNIIFGGK
jgi:DNA repair exonuclease SbcCD nuclease subunit